MNLEQKIAHFKKVSIEETIKETQEAIKDYQNTLDKQFEEYKAVVTAQEEKEYQAQIESAKREGNKKLAEEHIVNKRIISQKNAEITEKVFGELEKLVEDYRKTEDYYELVLRQIKSAREFAKNDEIIIYIDPMDAERKREIEQKAKCFLTISQYPFGGGMRAVIPARNILIDNSVESKLEELRSSFHYDGGDMNGR